MPGKTIDELYEAYMDKDVPFAHEVYEWFGGASTEWSPEEWERRYGMYLPTYDPTKVDLAARERDIDYGRAVDILDLSKRASDRVYATEVDTLSTGLEKEIGKGRTMAGEIGLRSGTLEQALEDTMAISSRKVKDLGDRLGIQKEEDKNTYNATMVDAALDFDKTEQETKEDLYNRTMAAVQRLTDIGAYDEPIPPPPEEQSLGDRLYEYAEGYVGEDVMEYYTGVAEDVVKGVCTGAMQLGCIPWATANAKVSLSWKKYQSNWDNKYNECMSVCG